MKTVLIIIALLLIGVIGYSVVTTNNELDDVQDGLANETSFPAPGVGPEQEPAPTTIVDAALELNDLTTLVAALGQAQLVDTLNGDGPFTVFAPTNDAFAKIDEATLASLLEDENRADLQNILTYHVVAGNYNADQITDGLTLETVHGTDITFTIENDKVMINGDTMITMTDMQVDNGVIHTIDTVLMPQR